eukprot:gnl/TRDRNA2_/TRDRNA2_42825_c0_seq1.p1 gnl/TRDRNA2_/TRDRNA2_42825_c0~~gnl/TRDRNA2_/TRDRNA2_42825_c0_seq1.p1  ORF type:complete len:383 (+),score=46.18 gnl/TRDRNA2_/TRDRNA2_42825_c0_seq1:65-1213(+)
MITAVLLATAFTSGLGSRPAPIPGAIATRSIQHRVVARHTGASGHNAMQETTAGGESLMQARDQRFFSETTSRRPPPTIAELEKCKLTTTDLQIRPEHVLFFTPGRIIVIQDPPLDEISSAASHRVQRYIAFIREDGTCLEEGGMHMDCSPSKRPAVNTEDLCSELAAAGGSENCWVASDPNTCGLVAPPEWIKFELTAGLGGHTEHSAVRVAVLGLGAGVIPAYIRKHFPRGDIVAVDIDPNVIFAASRYFGLTELEKQRSPSDGGRLQVLQMDARDWLRNQAAKSIDVLYIDSYDATDKAPAGLYGQEFLSRAMQKLSPGGRLVLVGDIDTAFPASKLAESLREIGFASVELPKDSNQGVVVGMLGGSDTESPPKVHRKQ